MTDIDERRSEPAAAQQFNLDYERVVLGAMMSGGAATRQVQDAGLEVGDFYKPAHRDLFEAICRAVAAGNPVEPFALAGQLAQAGTLGQVGGGQYLHDLLAVAPTAGQATWYAGQLLDLANLREVAVAAARVSQAVEGGADTDRLTALAQSVVRAATPRRADVGMVSLGEFAKLGVHDIEMRENAPPGLTTGLRDLDRLVGGFRAGQLVVIAGPTGGGKTTFAMDLARRWCIRERRVMGWFSGEMPTQELFDRCLSAQGGVLYNRIRDGRLDDNDWMRVGRALGPMSEAPMFFDDKGGITLSRVANNSRRLKAKLGELAGVVIDHVGLVKVGGRSESRNQELGTIIRDAKDLAMELDTVLFALVQQNRAPGLRVDKTPQLTDIRDSGEIEQSADVVMMLHREDYYDAESPRAGEMDAHVKKNRRGECGVVTVASQLHFSRFVDMAVE